MKQIGIMGIIPLLLTLSGCLSFGERSAAPVSDASQQSSQQMRQEHTPDADGGVQLRAYAPPAAASTQPLHSSAVSELLQQARQYQAQGNLPQAIATIERALRIEPRNGHLWNRLAHLRLDQKRPGLALDLAAKSSALAGGDVELKRDNWLVIAQARRLAGDVSGARDAERKARMLY